MSIHCFSVSKSSNLNKLFKSAPWRSSSLAPVGSCCSEVWTQSPARVTSAEPWGVRSDYQQVQPSDWKTKSKCVFREWLFVRTQTTWRRNTRVFLEEKPQLQVIHHSQPPQRPLSATMDRKYWRTHAWVFRKWHQKKGSFTLKNPSSIQLYC